ncbi:MAG: MATE family efflux transporter [Gemmatimonadota bacterium]
MTLRPGRADFASVIRLALPVAGVQVGLTAMGVVDTLMVGRVSAADLAAVALGNLYFFVVGIFGLGILLALDPVMAQAVGAGDREAAARGMQRGLALALVLGVVTALVLIPGEAVFRFARQPAEVIPIAAGYARGSILGAVPFFLFIVFRQSLQAMGRVSPIFWTAVFGNVANVFLNWVLIWGHLGVPPLGAVGSAWATSLSRWVLAIGLLVVAWPLLAPLLRPWRAEVGRIAPLLRMLSIGIPIGMQFVLEFGAFALTGILMGWLGTEPMAGHQIALNLSVFTFMVPMGIGAASAVLVGQGIGRGDAPGARRAAGASLSLALAFMSAAALVFLFFPEPLGRLFTGDPGVVAIVAVLLPIAGVFQISDGLQAVAAGVLRGAGDTRVPMLANILGFWLVGLPVSGFLGFGLGWGPAGLWWGLAAGLAAVAALLLLRVRVRFRRDLERLAVEG